MKTHNEVEQRRSMTDIPMIGDMSITDEHELVPLKTKMKVILNILKKEPSTAVILHDGKGKKMKIVGVITAEEVEAAINKGKKPKKLKVDDVILTKILELPSNIPITKALEDIQNKGPDAVIVRNHESRDFAGYFSVDDFREAKDIISQQKKRAQEFQHNTQSTMQKSALQQEMEDDDDPYVPEAMRSLPLSPELKATFKAQAGGGSARKSSDKTARERSDRTPVDYSAQVKLDDYICKRCNSVFTNENDLKQHSSWDPETQTIVCLDEKNDGPNDSPLSVPWEEGPSNQEEAECPFCAEPASRNIFVSLRKCPVCDETLSTEDLQTMIINAQEATEEDEAIEMPTWEEVMEEREKQRLQAEGGSARQELHTQVPCPYCAEECKFGKFFYLQSCPTCAEPLSSEDLVALEVIAAQVVAGESSDTGLVSSSGPSAAEKAVLVAQVPCPYCAEEDRLRTFNVLQSCPCCEEPLSSEDLAALEVIATQVAEGHSTTQFSPPLLPSEFSFPETTQNQPDHRGTCPNCGLLTAVILPDESYRCINCGEEGSLVATVLAADQATWDLCNPSGSFTDNSSELQSRLESVHYYLSNFPDGAYVIPATLLRNQLIARGKREIEEERAQDEGGSAQESSDKTARERSDRTPVDYSAQVKLDDYICPECNSVFTNGNDLKQHRSMDWETGTLVCLDENNNDPNDSPPSAPWEDGPPSTTQNQIDRGTCPNCGRFTAVILPDESYRCISCGERGSFVA